MQLLSGNNPTYGVNDPNPHARYVRQANLIDALIVFCVGVLFLEVIFKLCITTLLEFRLKPNKWLLRDTQVVLLTWWQEKLALAFKTVESTVNVQSFLMTKVNTNTMSIHVLFSFDQYCLLM